MVVERLPPSEEALKQLAPAEEAQTVIDSETRSWPLKTGDTLYLIGSRWYDQWKQYSGLSCSEDGRLATVVEVPEGKRRPRPGPIDNTDLLVTVVESSTTVDLEPMCGADHRLGTNGTDRELKEKLAEGSDFNAVFEDTWKQLHSWYGGGPSIKRSVVEQGVTTKTPVLDVYPLKLHVLYGAKVQTISISKQLTVADLKAKACEAFGVEEVDVQLWDYYGGSKYLDLETKLSYTLDEARIFDKQDILIEKKALVQSSDEDAQTSSWNPLPVSTQPSYRLQPYMEDSVIPGSKRPGLAGLQNLGNTCFMNSSLQCLSHTVPLLQTFLKDSAYRQDINRDNPLGMGGQLAEAFGNLLQKLWQGNLSVVTPRAFKLKLASFAPQFQGYSQQDSQELLAFLLDGLHEDLNRIKNKPYVEEEDADGRPDEDVAKEAWTNYRRRNDSVIVDHFQGLYKSTLVCPQCSYHSVKFDPFMYLSLPLPVSKTRVVTVTVIYTDGSQRPTTYAIEVSKNGTIGSLYQGIAKAVGITHTPVEEVMLVAEVEHCRVACKHDKLSARISEIHDRRGGALLAYVYPSAEHGPAGKRKEVQVFHRRVHKRPYSSSGTDRQVFAAPLVLWLPEEEVGELSTHTVKVSWGSEYVVSSAPALTGVLEAALRPFKRQKLSADGVGNIGADDFEELEASTPPVAEVNESMPAQESEDASSSGNHCSLVAADGNGCSDHDGPCSPSSADIEMADFELGPASSNSKTPAQQKAAGLTFPKLSSAVLVEPFDMWERNQEAKASSAEAAVAADAPYKLKRAQFNGETQFYGEFNTLSAMQTLYFVLDWEVDGGGAYDPELLEQPVVDESAKRAQEQDNVRANVTLSQCLDAFVQEEQLDPQDSWYCNRCKENVQADKKLDLWSLPEVLVIHLKRFSYSRLWRDKLDTPVDFPLKGLDLSAYLLQQMGPPPVYDLFAVSNHYGGLGGGHYTAYARMPDDGRWYCFDDSHVSDISEETVKSPAAYVLFYRRRDSMSNDTGVVFRAGAAQDVEMESAPDFEQASATDIEPGSPVANGECLPRRQGAATSSHSSWGNSSEDGNNAGTDAVEPPGGTSPTSEGSDVSTMVV